MNFDRSFLNIISEAVQSSKLQKLLNDVKAQYNRESDEAKVSILKDLCDSVSSVASRYIKDTEISKKDKIVLYALKDFSDSLYDTAEEKANLINEKITKKEAIERIIFPAVEEEYSVKISDELKNTLLNSFSDDYTRREYHKISKNQKTALTQFFKQIDASNITDDDVFEVSNLNDLSRKARGEYSVIGCYSGKFLIAIIYFTEDGKLNYIQSTNYGYEKLTMTKLNRICDKFIVVKKPDSADKKSIERYNNKEYVKNKSDDEQRFENRYRYNRLKNEKINNERKNLQQAKIAEVLAEAKEAVKTYDPELETEESTEIINAYKSLKKYVNASYAFGTADMLIDKIKNNIEKLKNDAGVTE